MSDHLDHPTRPSTEATGPVQGRSLARALHTAPRQGSRTGPAAAQAAGAPAAPSPSARGAGGEDRPKPGGAKLRQRVKAFAMGFMLIAIALLGPAVTQAGVSVIWPGSDHAAAVDTTPLITFAQGADYAEASSLGFASGFATSDQAAAFSITLSGLSGGTVIIDDYVAATVDAAVDTWNVEVASALTGTLTTPSVLKIRLWTGATAPTADGDAQVCGVLDLKAIAGTATSTSCADDAKIQVTYTLPSGASGSSSVSIRPTSITFA